MDKILVVEDDQFLREFYQELLQEEGYLVDVAADGEVALSKLKNNQYNLTLLDIMIPKKDGIEILKELKLTPSKQELTIVVLTNLGQDAVLRECMSLGVKGYLIKSALNPDQVLEQIKSYLQKIS